jgi:NAD(P)-dependent dehydrogenase (short-subunit alcohol dehydrogenase family)
MIRKLDFLLVIVFYLFNVLCAASNSPIVVLITGASNGIGKSTALEFAKNPKYKVWATMRNISSWSNPPVSNIRVAEMDVTSDSSVVSVVSQLIQEEGHIDVVVNNAGYGIVGMS